MSVDISRSQFIRGGSAAVAGAAIIAAGPKEAYTQQQKSDIEQMLEGATLKDHNGEELKLADLAKERDIVLAFGWGRDGTGKACPVCTEMAKQFLALQPEFSKRGDYPMFGIISVLPQHDGDPETMQANMKSWTTKGMKVSRKVGDAPAMPLFTIACPKDEAEAQGMETKLAQIARSTGVKRDAMSGVNRNDERIHMTDIAYFKKGKLIALEPGVGLNDDGDYVASPALIQKTKEKLLHVSAQGAKR